MLRRLGLVLLAVPLLAAAPAETPDVRARFFQKDKLRVLLLSGRNNHDWRTTTPFLRQLLVDTGRFDVRVVEEPAGLDRRDAGRLRPRRLRLLRPALGPLDRAGPRRLRPQRQGARRRPRRGLRLLRPRRPRRPPRPDRDHPAAVEGVRGDGGRLVADGAVEAVPRRPPLVQGARRGPRAPGLGGPRRGLRGDRRALPPDDDPALGPRPRHRVERPGHGRHREGRADPLGQHLRPGPGLLHRPRARGGGHAERGLQDRSPARGRVGGHGGGHASGGRRER